MAPQTLATEITSRGFTYRQLERHDDLAIYEQTRKTWPRGRARYEVIIIRVQPAHTWPNGDISPEQEVYPSSGSWGRLGWTTYTRQEAQEILRNLQRKRAAVAEVQP
jgi:hypothetical protein